MQGELFGELIEMDCPNCYELVGTVTFPTNAEVLAKGTEQEKKEAREVLTWHERKAATQLGSIDGLTEINGSIKIELKEIESKDKGQWLEVYANDQLLWKEMVGYEYYERFIGLCHMLDNKYKGQIETIEYASSTYLWGDSLSAGDEVDACIDAIKADYKKE